MQRKILWNNSIWKEKLREENQKGFMSYLLFVYLLLNKKKEWGKSFKSADSMILPEVVYFIIFLFHQFLVQYFDILNLLESQTRQIMLYLAEQLIV